jgi:hypothetical protein
MAIQFLDDVKVEADLTVTPESGEGLLTINSNSSYGNTRIKMSNPQGGEATVMSSYSNPGANYFEIKYDNGAAGSGEFRVKNDEIDCGFDSSTTPITRVSSTGLRIAGGLQLSGTFEDSSADVGTAGQVLSSTGTGTNWINPPCLIASGGGRAYVTTATDDNERALVLGGSIGFSYYNWSTQMRGATSSFTGLGNPGTTTTSVTPYSAVQGVFQVLQSGTIRIQGTCEGQNNIDVYNDKVYIYVFKLPPNIVSAMGNGSGQANSNYTLVASAECTMPSSGASQRPQSFESSNGETVSAGDWVFASLSFAGTVTATRYFYTNFSMATL